MAKQPSSTVSPLAPARFPDMPAIAGVRLGVGTTGTRYVGRPDLFLAELPPGTTMAGVFTRSTMPGAPVEWCRRALAKNRGQGRGIAVNAGNANVFTGRRGREASEAMAAGAARLVGCKPEQVMVCSTGTIGEPLAYPKVVEAMAPAHAKLSATAWPDAARAIMTTDTFPKGATRTARIGETTVTLNGIAKGSGMIQPDMATMLCFLFTDAKIPAPVLQRLLARSADRTFNAITVDSDTSTSDTCLLFATGEARHPRVASPRDAHLRDFARALEELMRDLALQVVRDGEGAEKLITITVSGAVSARSARKVGLAIANSPLVKTAIAGGDANWGRIVMAVGKSGEKADRDTLAVRVGGVLIAEKGDRVADYDETPVAAHVRGRDVRIEVDLGIGRGKATVWTCDLTHRYIDINADYRS